MNGFAKQRFGVLDRNGRSFGEQRFRDIHKRDPSDPLGFPADILKNGKSANGQLDCQRSLQPSDIAAIAGQNATVDVGGIVKVLHTFHGDPYQRNCREECVLAGGGGFGELG